MDSLRLECSNGFTLVARDECICIYTKKSEEKIPCTAIKTVTVKEPGIAFGKFIFNVDQQNTAGLHLGFGLMAAIGAERSFFFKKDDWWTAEKMRDYILECQKPKPVIQQVVASAPAAPVDTTVDQIRRLKSLLDEGILTQEEFDAKKKKILGI